MVQTMTDAPLETDRAAFLQKLVDAARASGHIWPTWAAVEAALDSDWGTTELAQKANNVFNLRAPARFASNMANQIYVQTVNGKQYDWLKFGTLEACFAARMGKLRSFGMYYQAVRAKSGAAYIDLISPIWSADKERAAKVRALVPITISMLPSPEVLP